jgi:small subunit ribosomal protein S3
VDSSPSGEGTKEESVGRKVHPVGLRLGIIRDWDSNWFAEGEEFSRRVVQDAEIRDLIHHRLGRAGISRIQIERYAQRIRIAIRTAKPGIVIGRRGASIQALTRELQQATGLSGNRLRIDVDEAANPDLEAKVVAEGIAEQLERRVSFRRAMRRTAQRTMRAGAEGIKIAAKGRLSGSEMSRREWMLEGRVPLHTLRADIDYAVEEAITTFGRIGIKVWIYRGDILPEPPQSETDR